MIHSISVYPFDPFELETGVNSIQVSSTHLFFSLTQGLREENDKVFVCNAISPVNPQKVSIFLGDIAVGCDVNSLFLRECTKQLLAAIQSEEIANLQLLVSELESQIDSIIWENDLPLCNSNGFAAKNVISFFKPQVTYEETCDAYNNMLSLIEIAGALPEKKTLVTLHITSYCSKEQVLSIHKELLDRNMQLIDLERIDQRIDLKGIRDYFVDEDFVQFS